MNSGKRSSTAAFGPCYSFSKRCKYDNIDSLSQFLDQKLQIVDQNTSQTDTNSSMKYMETESDTTKMTDNSYESYEDVNKILKVAHLSACQVHFDGEKENVKNSGGIRNAIIAPSDSDKIVENRFYTEINHLLYSSQFNN